MGRESEPRTITLLEYETQEAVLTREAYEVLRSRYSRYIDVAARERPGLYLLGARDYVGRIGLPGGVLLVIKPKIPSANLFAMLSGSAGLARFYAPPSGITPDPEIFTFVLALLVEGAERLAARGLLTAYMPVEADLSLVRGRIVLGAQVARYASLQHRHVCAYADLTQDTPENRVLYAALHGVATLLRDPKEELSRRVRVLLPRFHAVTLISRGEALQTLRGVSFGRLNAAYAPVLGLARLALQHLTLDEKPGNHPFASFLVNMPRLFESYVTEALRKHVAAFGLSVVAQRHDYLDAEKTVGIRPDVLLYGKGRDGALLVLDAKYRRLDTDDGLNRDLYQVSAYIDRYKLNRGVLVYPLHEGAVDTEMRLLGSHKRLSLITLDLGGGVREMARAAEAMSARVARYAQD